VITLVTELETLNFYSLNANYFDNFSIAKEYADNEVIFSYNHSASQIPANGNGLAAITGWGFIAPTTDFLNAFEANDPRKLYTINTTEQVSYKIMGDTTAANKGNEQAPSNKVLIRWADVMLWKAEAYNESNNPSAAIALINKVRQRARTTIIAKTNTTPPAGTLPDRNVATTDKATITNWIRQERRVELGFESQRFSDLRRWKTAKQVLTALGRNFQDRNYLYPIPQIERDRTGGSMPQNKDY
jgi:starch-binding outer membrane protein, SusD/RagB family